MALTAAELEIVVGADTKGAEDGLNRVNKSVNRTSGDFLAAGGVFLAGGGIIAGGFAGAIGMAADFEQQMSYVGSATGKTGKELEALEDMALRLGGSTSFSAMEVGQAMEVMAKAGVDMSEDTVKSMLDLAAATGTDVPLATETAAAAMTQFGVSGEEAANIISQSSNASAMDVNDWALALKSAGPVAASLGVPMEDLAAGMMILADNGIKGEVAATAMRNILMSLGNPTAEVAAALNDLGVSTTYADGTFKGLEQIMTEMAPTWKNLTDEQKLYYAEQIAGKDGAAAFLTMMNEQSDAVENNTSAFEERKKAMAGVGTAEEQAAARMDNFRGAIETLKGALETLVIIIGSMFLPVLTKIAEAGTEVVAFLLMIPAPIQKVIAGFVALVGGTSALVGMFLVAKGAMMALAPGFLSILGPALLVVGAITAVAAAFAVMYKLNMFGIADKIRSVGSAIGEFFNVLKLSATGDLGFHKAVKELPAPLQTLAKGLNDVIRPLIRLGAAFSEGGLTGLIRQWPKEVAILKKGFDQIGQSIKGFAKSALSFGKDAVTDLTKSLIKNAPNVAKGAVAITKNLGQTLSNGWKTMKSTYQEGQKLFNKYAMQYFGTTDLGSIFKQMLEKAFGTSNIGSIFSKLRSALGTGIKTALNGAIDALSGWYGLVADALNAIPWESLGSIVAKGLAGVVGALAGLAALIVTSLYDGITGADWGQLGTAIKDLLKAAFDAITGFADGFITEFKDILSNVDWSGVWDGIKDAASNTWDAITSFFSGLDWAGLWSGLKTAASTAWDAVSSFFSNIDWGVVGSAISTGLQGALNVLASVGSWVVEKLADFTVAVYEWAVEQFEGVDWAAALKASWSAVLQLGSWIVSKLASFTSTVYNWVVEQFEGIDWKGALAASWSAMLDLGGWIVGKLKSFTTSVYNWAKEQFEGIDWTAAIKASWSAVLDLGEWIRTKITATGLYEFGTELMGNLIDGFKDTVSDGIDWVKGKIGELIDAYNAIPILPDIENPFAEVESGAVAASIGVDAYKNSIGKLKDQMSSLGQVSKSAIDILTGTQWNPTSDGGIQENDTGTTAIPVPEAVPVAEPQGFSGGGLAGMFQRITAAAGTAKTAIGSYSVQQALMGAQSTATFGQMKAGADAGIVPLGGLFANTSNQMATSWSTNMNRMAFANNGSWTDVNVTATTQSNAAKNSAISNIGAMASSVSARMIAIAGSTRTNMSAASATTLGQMTAMQTSTALSLASMASTASSKMSAIASTTKSQMSAANSSVSTQMLAMQLGVATKMAMMNTSANTSMGNMVSTTRTQTASMTSAMMGGMANTAMQVTLGASRWSSIVSSAGASAAGTARSVGYNIGAGVASGLYAALGSVTAAANAIIGQVDRAMRAKAQIHSPSRMTAYLGQMMGEGLAVGMTDMLGDVSKAGLMLSDAASIKPEATLSVGMPVSSNQAYARNEAPTSSTTVHVTNHYTVTVDDLDDVKNATDFVKNLKKEYSLAV